MNKLIGKIFGSNVDYKQINFGEIFNNRTKMVVIFPQELTVCFELYAFFSTWKEEFKAFDFYFPEKYISFFKKMNFSPTQKFFVYDEFESYQDGIIILLADEFPLMQELRESVNTIICDKTNVGNLRFYPPAANNITLFRQFSRFFSLPIKKGKLQMQQSLETTYLLKNGNYDIVLDISLSKHQKYIEPIIKMVKQDFKVNFYLTDINYAGDAFLNVINIKSKKLLERYELAKNSLVFISDNYEISNIFSHFNINQIFFGKAKTFTKIHCIHPKDIFELKSLIKEFIERQKI